ncbi:MAG TPA: hypothetical protein VF292_13625 [Rhodanobacteraceae bacterium]
MPQNKLYVGNLPFAADEPKLRSVFSAYGDITHVTVITDPVSGRPKGFAFIAFGSPQAAEKALEQNGQHLDGRPLRVSLARERNVRGDQGDSTAHSRGRRTRW